MEIENPLILDPKPDQPEKSSNFQFATNLFKSSLGIGVLALPYCFNQSGILLSIVFMIIMAVLTVYTVFKIIELADIKGLKETNFKELYKDYVGDVAVNYFQICMAINYFGIGVTYVIFFIDFFKNTFNTNGLLYSLIYSALSLCIIIPLSLIRKLEVFAKYSFLGNFLTILVFLIIIQHPIRKMDFDNVQNYGNIVEIPGLLGVAIFAYVSPGLVIPMRNSMKNKEAFKPTFLIVIIIIFFIYVGFSIICCYGFTPNNLTQNILKGFGNLNKYYLMAQGLYALALILSYPMQLSPLIEVIENIPKIKVFLKVNQKNWVYKNSIRILISFLIFPLGIFISKFANFINLLGAFCFFVIQFIYPLWAYNNCFSDSLKKSVKYINYSIIFISFIGILLSCYHSILALIAEI